MKKRCNSGCRTFFPRPEIIRWSTAIYITCISGLPPPSARGGVSLAGDSAHVNNPLGGLGLNFGIHDAVELAGLLGTVIRCEAPASTLDGYHRRRRPLNVEYVQQQTIANKKRLEEKTAVVRSATTRHYALWPTIRVHRATC